jgi:8-oxo-dGTP pyrophosphatase MutT (NUDIX family)
MLSMETDGRTAPMTGGEQDVPPEIWRTPSFQRWYTAQRDAGNVLLGARPVWKTTIDGESGTVFFWALHVRVHVVAEDRTKDNEIVISRPDVSVVVLYRPAPSLDETTVVFVREFRSPASTPDGYVHELPGGSSPAEAATPTAAATSTAAANPAEAADGADAADHTETGGVSSPVEPLAQAVEELAEETGLRVDASRFRAHGSRQVAATVSAHHAHLFSVEVTDDELAWLRTQRDRPHGVDGDSERTWVEIATFGEVRAARLVDWATLGMLAEALSEVHSQAVSGR